MFEQIRISHWRQFADVSVRFHPRLTVLTGANGAGKTTLLNILNKHFGWNLSFVSTRMRRRDLVGYFADYWEQLVDDAPPIEPGRRNIGFIGYSNGERAALAVPTDVSQVYDVEIQNRQAVDGIFISSHRPVYLYQRVDSIPTEMDARDQLLSRYLDELRSRYNINTRVTSPNYRIKEALISLATFGYGNQAVTPNPEAAATYEGFVEILRIVLPPKLGFGRLRVDVPDVLLETATGDFSFDAVSGGVSAIIDIAWQTYMYSLTHDQFSVLIDEPENHLHPELQQGLLPSLLEAFPRAQFTVATHNPFIVGSVADSNVYVLDYNDDRKVQSQLLDTVNKAGSANEILRDVLGLSHTIPLWVEEEIDEIVAAYAQRYLDGTAITDLKRDMDRVGLGHLFPAAMHDIARTHDQASEDQ